MLALVSKLNGTAILRDPYVPPPQPLWVSKVNRWLWVSPNPETREKLRGAPSGSEALIDVI